MTFALLVALLAAPGGEPLSVGVLPTGGNAPAPVRAKTTEALVGALRGITSLEVVSLGDIGGLLGAGAREAIERCADDACRADLVKPLETSRLVMSELFAAPGGLSLEVRLVDPAAAGAPLVRVSREVKAEGDVPGAAAKAATDLFPDRVAREGFGTLILEVSPDGAEIALDGTTTATAPAPPLKVAAGAHTVRARARGHRPAETRVEVPLGGVARAELDLEKRRSKWPLLLGAGAVAAAGTGIVFGVLAKGTASDWSDACGAGACPRGFTRERYDDDDAKLSVQRGLANGLIGAGVALAAGAVIWFFADPGSEP